MDSELEMILDTGNMGKRFLEGCENLNLWRMFKGLKSMTVCS